MFNEAGFRLDQTLSDHGTVTRGVCQRDSQGYLVGVEEFFELKKNGTKVAGKNKDGKAGEFAGDIPVEPTAAGSTVMTAKLDTLAAKIDALRAEHFRNRENCNDAK